MRLQQGADSWFVTIFLIVVLAFPAADSHGSASNPVTPLDVGYSYFSFSGIFQLVFPNGTNKAFNSNAMGLTGVTLNQTLEGASENSYEVGLAAAFQLDGTRISSDESLELNVSTTMLLTHNGLSLGYYYLWMPYRYTNDSQVDDYLTVTDTDNRTYDLAGNVVESGGFDYLLVSNRDPYVSIVNVYNASTGAAVFLMIPGRSSLSTSMIESGNFTLGHKDIAYTPLGSLLNLNWFDFEPTWAGAWVSPHYDSRMSEFLGKVVPFMEQQNELATITSAGPGAQNDYVVPAVLLVGSAVAAILLWLFLNNAPRPSRPRSRTR